MATRTAVGSGRPEPPHCHQPGLFPERLVRRSPRDGDAQRLQPQADEWRRGAGVTGPGCGGFDAGAALHWAYAG